MELDSNLVNPNAITSLVIRVSNKWVITIEVWVFGRRDTTAYSVGTKLKKLACIYTMNIIGNCIFSKAFSIFVPL